MPKVFVMAVAMAVVAQIGAAEALPASSFDVPRSGVASPPALTEVQYYYKGHTYKRRTKQHFIRKYSGSDR